MRWFRLVALSAVLVACSGLTQEQLDSAAAAAAAEKARLEGDIVSLQGQLSSALANVERLESERVALEEEAADVLDAQGEAEALAEEA